MLLHLVYVETANSRNTTATAMAAAAAAAAAIVQKHDIVLITHFTTFFEINVHVTFFRDFIC